MNPEQAAFEHNIDQNPHDATNHLVYADWLDENGQPEEAAFRRAMGKWIESPSVRKEMSPLAPHRGVSYAHTIAYPFLPKWVFDGEPPVPGYGSRHAERLMYSDSPGASVAHPHVAMHYPDPYDSYRWLSYRGMEEAFRRAFMEHRKQNPEQYAKSYATAIRPPEPK